LKGIHGFTKSTGRILLDSGGFQLYRRNLNLDYNETLEIYKDCQINPNDFAISLDFCPFLMDLPETRLKKIKQTIATYQAMVAKNQQVIPVIHGTTKKEFELSLTQITEGCFISYASNFPLITMTLSSDEILNNRPSVKDQIITRFITFLKLLREHRLECRIHILGATGQNSSHLMWYAGMDQTDSSAWRLKASFGKIALIGVSEAKISSVPSTFGVHEWKPEHDILLKECECPICKHLDLKQRKLVLGTDKTLGFNNRCVHNAFVYLQERDLAREMIGRTIYRLYLEKRFKGTWWMKFLHKVDETRTQKELDFYIK
jgi:queuine/archaeosine tRNA-ribosyltransferase